jgi:ATP-dependent RNA helicase DOB1
MQDMARRIAQNSRDAKIDLDVDEYVSKFKPFMMDVVFEWCKGATFSEICKMTDLFEGKVDYVNLLTLIQIGYKKG